MISTDYLKIEKPIASELPIDGAFCFQARSDQIFCVLYGFLFWVQFHVARISLHINAVCFRIWLWMLFFVPKEYSVPQLLWIGGPRTGARSKMTVMKKAVGDIREKPILH